MKKKDFILIVILFTSVIITINITSQNNYQQQLTDLRRESIHHFKNFKLTEVSQRLKLFSPYKFSMTILKNDLLYYKDGVNTFPDLINEKIHERDYIDSVLYYNYLGDYYSRKLKPNDSLSFKNHLKAYTISKQHNDTLFINESLRRLNFFFLKNFKDQNLYLKYVNELSRFSQDEIDMFWVKYFALVYDMTYSSFSQKEFKKLENRFLNLKEKTPKSSYFTGTTNQMTGIFYTYKQDIKSSRYHFLEAYNAYRDSSFYITKRRMKAKFSVVTLRFDEKNYGLLIEELKELFKDSLIHNDLELKKMTYEWLEESYDSINDDKNRRHYSKLLNETNTLINSYAQAESAREQDVKYKAKETKEENQNLKSKNKSLETRFLTILPVLGGTILILIFTFYLYKRYKKKSAILEEEQSETLQKLDELKSIVIKNHIILKDKTKVYISDLMYIKSDDHYLEIFSQDKKSHTVRGKLSQIKEELPPNFIQCHRSYIVNSNFIKQVNSNTLTLINKEQIPLSRSYKKKF